MSVSKMPPVRRSQIWVCRQLQRAHRPAANTHPYRLVEAARDDVQLVELEARHGRGVAEERAVRLAGAHCARETCVGHPASSKRAGKKEAKHSLSHIRTAPSPLPLTRA